jgi:decaprenylphospho-beta-D-ribofuranose 2-oxidase
MKKIILVLLVILLIILVTLISWFSSLNKVTLDSNFFADVARLYPTKVKEVRKETKVEDLVSVLADARDNGLKISIAGSQHSQGGHTYYDDAIVLDMKEFDEILKIDVANKKITVESGATWQDIQEQIQPVGLAIKVMQSSYVFTVGGSLSANAHGRDLDASSIIETVDSFRLLLADGTIKNVSRTENSDLFGLVIGGYGLFGVILDVTLNVTEDVLYEKKTVDVDYKKFVAYFKDKIQTDETAQMMLIRPSVDITAPDFMQTLTVSTWHTTDHEDSSLFTLGMEENVLRDTFLFDLSRRFDWAKSLRWKLQKAVVEEGGASYVSRNNAMRPPVAPLDFLDYHAKNRTDIIQEYYIPIENFASFMDSFRDIILKDNINIISSTIRYVKANNEAEWSYAPQKDVLAVIVMSNIALNKGSVESAAASTKKIVAEATRLGGSYYLTYQLFPSTEQLYTAYPNTEMVFSAKLKYDPTELFMSMFYEQYAKGVDQLNKLYE